MIAIEPLLTPKDIAAVLGVCPNTATKLMARMPGCININGSIKRPRLRVTRRGFEDWLKERDHARVMLPNHYARFASVGRKKGA